MVVLAIVGVMSGIGCIMQMIAWCIETWLEADEEERNIVKFEKNKKHKNRLGE